MKSIIYSNNKEAVNDLELGVFFEDWPKKPKNEMLKKSILGATHCVLAIDKSRSRLIGYITAVSDGVLSAYIPFLEVEPEYRNKGIGVTLTRKMITQLSDLYMIDLVCDKELADFYSQAEFKSWHAMIRRNYDALLNSI